MTDRESSREKGRQAEELACAHLRRQGLATLGKNWTCRRGELDLVMLDGDT
ncbi:YraN family protein, partial [Pseudomonas aeruginosa]